MARWRAVKTGWSVQVLAAGCLLLAGTAGCGSQTADPSVSGKPAKVESRAAEDKPEDRKGTPQPAAQQSGQITPLMAAANGSDGANMLPVQPAPQDKDDLLNIPEDVAKGLGSENARDRLRALDHWAKDKKAPMDPVFDLAEDEDPAVRAKAEAIIDKYLESGEERE